MIIYILGFFLLILAVMVGVALAPYALQVLFILFIIALAAFVLWLFFRVLKAALNAISDTFKENFIVRTAFSVATILFAVALVAFLCDFIFNHV